VHDAPAPQAVPAVPCVQALAPLQVPVLPQGGLAVHWPAGAAVPAGEVVFSGNKYVLDDLGTQRFSRFGAKLTAAGWQSAGLDAVGTFLAN